SALKWSSKVTKRFSAVPVNVPENDYYAPYNKFLNSLFPPDSDYTVVLRSYSILNSHKSVDLVIGFVVLLEDEPVLFLEIEEPRRITLTSARKEVDNHMRIRTRDLAPTCPLEILNGVSAFGTQLSFYTCDKQTRMIIPARISHMETDAPLDRWDWKTKGLNGSKISLQKSR
ncbi:hypothetical protein EDB83DRAFT_700148, partial [Lactarius deliciosus]